jgi:glycosyltransferase involved in cell wall biosynthesis
LIEPLGMMRPIDRGFALKKLWRTLVGCYLEKARRLIATSELEKQELLESGFPPEALLLRYNGIDSDDFKALPPTGAFRREHCITREDRLVLFLGRLIPRKGADLLIEALGQMGPGKSRITVVIAGPEGEAGYLAFLQKKARALGVDHRVRLLGPLYEDDKKSAMVDADVFVLPSRYENFGNTAAEAIACGTPAIVSDRCGIAPLIHQRAGLVTQYDSRDIARTLNQLLGDRVEYERLRAGCASVAAEISWDKLIRELEFSYRDVSAVSSRRREVLVA